MRTGSTWTTRPRVRSEDNENENEEEKDSISAPTNTAVAAISSSSSSSSSTNASGKRSSASLSTVASSSSAKKKKENSASDTSATIYPQFDDIYDSVQAEAFSETALTTVKPVNAATTTASASNAEYVLFTKYFARCICNQKQSAKPNIEERVREDLNFAKYMRPLRRWLDETLSKKQVAELGALPSIDD